MLGDLDNDGNIEMIVNGIQRWDRLSNKWVQAYSGERRGERQRGEGGE